MIEFTEGHVEEGVGNIQEKVDPVSGDSLHIAVPKENTGMYKLPRPASKHLPEWYKQTEVRPDESAPLAKSVRACMPFMEALTLGWIVPTPADLAITRGNGGLHVEWDDDSHKVLGSHDKEQVGGADFPHEGEILKFNLPYQLRTPEGVSTLYMPPLNRIETRFRAFSGVVDTDAYMNETNIPALVTDTSWEGVIEAGTPLVQIIPFVRDGVVSESITRSMTDYEEKMRRRVNQAVGARPAYYKQDVWEPIESSREAGGCPLGFGDTE